MEQREHREEIIQISLKLIDDGVINDGQGNLSIYDRSGGRVAITPSGVPYRERNPEDICLVDLQGNLLDGRWKPTSEMALHLVYYNNRKDVSAVVHTHAPYSTVLGITGEESVPMVLNESAMCLGGAIPVAPYGRPGTQKLADLTFQATGQGTASIMAHHGLVTVGETLQEAYLATTAAEATAEAVILARSMGAEVHSLSDEEVAVLREMFLSYGPSKA